MDLSPNVHSARSRSKTFHSYECDGSLNVVHQINIPNDSLKWRLELCRTRSQLKQMKRHYMQSLHTIKSLHQQIEDNKLLHNVIESILIEKNEILTQRLSEFKDKYQQIEIKHKYIDDDTVDVEEDEIPTLELRLSNEKIQSLQQSLNTLQQSFWRKDNEIEKLSQKVCKLQTRNKYLTSKYDELRIINTEIYESQKGMKLETLELTQKCLILQKEKNELQQLWETQHEHNIIINDKQNEMFPMHQNQRSYMGIIHSIAMSLDGLYDQCDPHDLYDPYDRYVSSNLDETHSILEDKCKDERTDIDESREPADTEEDLVNQLLQNEDFMNSEAVKQLVDTEPEDKTLTTCPHHRIKMRDLDQRGRQCSLPLYQYCDHTKKKRQNAIKCVKHRIRNASEITTFTKQIKHLRNNKSIANVKKNCKQSVTGNVIRFGDITEKHFVEQTETKPKITITKQRPKNCKKDDNGNGNNNSTFMYSDSSVYNTVIYKGEDIRNALKSYS